MRIWLFIPLLLILYAGLNYNWVHAAVAYQFASSTCDPQLLNDSRERLRRLYGVPVSAPAIGCMDAPALGQGHIIGTTNFAPGLPSIILLNSDGQQTDVLAHEWAHAELVDRIGVIKRTLFIPVWFDEGLAMQVDDRPYYGLEALAELKSQVQPTPIVGLSSSAAFFQAGVQGRYHYALARCVVARWLLTNPTWQQSIVEHQSLQPFPEQSMAQHELVCLGG